MINCVRSFRFCSVYTVIIRCLVYRILSCCHCFINFSFCCCLLFICRIRRLIDFAFSSAAFLLLFCLSFLTTVGWILLIVSTPFVFAVSTPALFVAWSIAFLAVVTASSTFAFAAFSSSVAFGVWSICFSLAALSIAVLLRFLTTVGWILIESKPLISQCLHLRYLLLGLLTLSHYLRSSTFAFAAAFSSSVASGV